MNQISVKALLLIAVLAFYTQLTSASPIRVTNGQKASNGTQIVVLEELWTVGEEDSDLILGEISQVLIDDQGNIYLLDTQLSNVKVISPDGVFLRTLGREGEGPGEFRNPSEMCFLPDGHLGVLQGSPGKIVHLNLADGTPAGVWPLSAPGSGGEFQMDGLRVGGETVIVSGTIQTVDREKGVLTRDDFLASLDLQTGLVGRKFVERSSSLDFGNIRLDENDLSGGPTGRYDVLPDGRLVVAIPRNGYEVSIFALDGSLERVFTREFVSWQRDEQASGIWIRILETLEKRLAPGCEVSWEETEPDVQSLFVTSDGNICIQNSRGRWDPAGGIFTAFDVFNAEGVFEKEIAFVCEGDPRQDMLFFLDYEQVLKVNGFWGAALSRFGGAGNREDDSGETGTLTVTCYKVKSQQ